MNKEKCEEVYGKLIKEDDDFLYFEGRGEHGVCIPKHTYFVLQPERSKREDFENLGHDLTGIPTTEESWCRNCGEEDHVIELTKMRCSEH